MSGDERTGDDIRGSVSGTVSGPVAIGKDIHQAQHVGTLDVQVTEAELGELRAAFTDLKRQVADAAPPEERENPIVGRLVEAAGDAVVGEFKQLLGSD